MVQTVMYPFCPSFFPIGDNITMLTTADWLLGSNSQSAAGLSTFSDTMKGQYLVFSPLFRMKAFFVVYLFEPPTLLVKKFNFSSKICQLQNYKVASIIVPFIQKLLGICCNCYLV